MSSARALITAQGWPIKPTAAFKIAIWIGEGEAPAAYMSGKLAVFVSMHSKSTPDWYVTVYDARTQPIRDVTITGGKPPAKDPIGLPPLRDIARLPGWLVEASKVLGCVLDAARVDAGRAKGAEAAIAEWLRLASVKPDGGRAAPKTLLEWAGSPCPAVFDPKTQAREQKIVRTLLPVESADLTADEARRVAARIMAARAFVLTAAVGATMSDVMREALADALLVREWALSSPLHFRFLSKALHLAPGPEIEAFEKRAKQLFVPLPKMLERASTLPSTPALVAAAQAACTTFAPWEKPVALGIPEDWLVFVLLARDGSKASAAAVRAAVLAQEAAAVRARDDELRCAAVVAKIASSAQTAPFHALAKELASLAGPRVP
jgi:hypothetical protein